MVWWIGGGLEPTHYKATLYLGASLNYFFWHSSWSTRDWGENFELVWVVYWAQVFWGIPLKKYLPKEENLIICGDLKFLIGAAEVWGPNAFPDNHSDFFSHVLVSQGLIDSEPIKICPTQCNKRMRDDHVTKRIDRFLISKKYFGPTITISAVGEDQGGDLIIPLSSWKRLAVPENLQAPSNLTLNGTWMVVFRT